MEETQAHALIVNDKSDFEIGSSVASETNGFKIGLSFGEV